jgi:hypothetical protein
MQGPQVVLSVELSADEDVQWNWTHTPKGSYVSGYTIIKKKSVLMPRKVRIGKIETVQPPERLRPLMNRLGHALDRLPVL